LEQKKRRFHDSINIGLRVLRETDSCSRELVEKIIASLPAMMCQQALCRI